MFFFESLQSTKNNFSCNTLSLRFTDSGFVVIIFGYYFQIRTYESKLLYNIIITFYLLQYLAHIL